MNAATSAQSADSHCLLCRDHRRRRSASHSQFWFLIVLCFVCLAEVSIQADEKPASKPLIVFSAMGDVPYAPEEYVELPKQIAGLPKESQFVVHVGDIKTSKVLCEENVYDAVSQILKESKIPLFIIPGDNEWNDCAQPDVGWSLWMKYFSRLDEKWKHDLQVRRQKVRDENFAFVRSEVLFIGLNIVGGRVHDKDEWKRRHAECLEWTRQNLAEFGKNVRSVVIFGHAYPVAVHSDYFDGLSETASQFEKPILYLHGDGHRWIRDRPFKAKNIERIQVDQGGIAPPIKVTVTDHPTDPFVVDRRKEE